MKKIITIALVLVVSISMVFADDVFDSFKADLKANEAKGFAETLEGYMNYINNEMLFLENRNNRIKTFCNENNL